MMQRVLVASAQERWRYRAEAPYLHAGVCLLQPVVTADTVFAAGETRLYAVHRAIGRDLWKAIEVQRPVRSASFSASPFAFASAPRYWPAGQVPFE
jgi:hypothetical protein